MRLKYTFETTALDDKVIAVPVGEGAERFRAVVRLNDSAAEIFDLLKEETTVETTVAELTKQHGNDPEILGFVQEVVEYLKSEGVLE